MKIQEFAPEDIIILPEFRTRKSEPDAKKINAIAENMLARHEEGLNPQIQAGVVRPGEDGKHILVAGETRLLAIKQLNESSPDGTEPFKFQAIVARENDLQAVLTSIEENHFRSITSIFDRAVAVEKLMAMGMTQEEVAVKLGLKQSTISETLLVGKLGKKYQAMVIGGKLTEDAAKSLARVPPSQRDEILQAATEYQQALDDIEARATEREDAVEDDGAEPTVGNGKKKATNIRPEVPKAKKAVKVTAEAVKSAARKKGAMKESSAGRTKKELISFLNAFFGPDVQEAIPEPARDLCEALEIWLDGDRKDKWLRDKIIECCKARHSSSSASAAA